MEDPSLIVWTSISGEASLHSCSFPVNPKLINSPLISQMVRALYLWEDKFSGEQKRSDFGLRHGLCKVCSRREQGVPTEFDYFKLVMNEESEPPQKWLVDLVMSFTFCGSLRVLGNSSNYIIIQKTGATRVHGRYVQQRDNVVVGMAQFGCSTMGGDSSFLGWPPKKCLRSCLWFPLKNTKKEDPTKRPFHVSLPKGNHPRFGPVLRINPKLTLARAPLMDII